MCFVLLSKPMSQFFITLILTFSLLGGSLNAAAFENTTLSYNSLYLIDSEQDNAATEIDVDFFCSSTKSDSSFIYGNTFKCAAYQTPYSNNPHSIWAIRAPPSINA